METQLFQDRFGAMFYDDARNILELRWFRETEFMTDDDYMGWLERYAASAEQHHRQRPHRYSFEECRRRNGNGPPGGVAGGALSHLRSSTR